MARVERQRDEIASEVENYEDKLRDGRAENDTLKKQLKKALKDLYDA